MAVSVVGCSTYEYDKIKNAVREAIESIDGLREMKTGARVAIKANLVSSASPEKATTTHPAVLSAITELCLENGAESVVIGDSPGGFYNASFVERVYKLCGLHSCMERGAVLNSDYSEASAYDESAKVCKTFMYTAYLDNADFIIDACKLKTHGMMGLSCAAKNMFGVIPGTMKPEYHFRYPSYEAFADMIVDLNEYFKPSLSVCDAVIGMEGNGPTAGTPREIGCILASGSPYELDMIAASLIGLTPMDVPTIAASVERGLCPSCAEKIEVVGDPKVYHISDYENIAVRRSLLFKGNSDNVLKNMFGAIAKRALNSKPVLKSKLCVGCNLCGRICPAKAITIEKGKAVINRSECIRCFCCQEFCPKGAMKVKRTLIASILEKGKSRKNKNR